LFVTHFYVAHVHTAQVHSSPYSYYCAFHAVFYTAPKHWWEMKTLGGDCRLTSQGPKAPCGLQGCKNRPTPFPGRMSYKVTKPGSVYHTLACFVLYYCLLGPIFMYFRCYMFCLFGCC